MGCTFDRLTPLLAAALLLSPTFACDGTLLDAPGPESPELDPAGPKDPPQSPIDPASPNPAPVAPVSPTEPEIPTEPELPVIDPFASATVGKRCVAAGEGRFLVLGGTDGACSAHATSFESMSAPVPFAWAALPEVMPLGQDLALDATVCLQAGACRSRTLVVRFDSFADGQPALGSWSMELEGARGEGRFSAAWCNYDGGGGERLSTAATLQEVAIYQAVRVAIARDAQVLGTRNAPIVADREALVRVFVSPRPGASEETVVARLTLESVARGPVVLESSIPVTRVSTETNPDSTFNFLIPRDTLTTDTRFSVSLHGSGQCSVGGPVTGARVPATGTASLDVRSPGGSLEVVLVPIRYQADGSNRVPDTSADQIARYRDRIYALFPAAEVSITVRDSVGWDAELQRNGSGWSNLLQALMNLRASDRAASHVYYYGIFTPAASFNTFCNGGCVAGLGAVPSANDTYSRAAIGLGYSGAGSADTAAHELGHTLGRQHAPCGVQDADPQYPYSGGGIGVWGFNVLSNALVAPNQNTDFMGYCNPAWVSDYNFSALFQRLEYVNRGRATQNAGVEESYRVAIADLDGLRWGEPVVLLRAPQGETVTARVVAADGRVTEHEIVRYELADLGGTISMVPSHLLAAGARLELPEGGLTAQ